MLADRPPKMSSWAASLLAEEDDELPMGRNTLKLRSRAIVDSAHLNGSPSPPGAKGRRSSGGGGGGGGGAENMWRHNDGPIGGGGSSSSASAFPLQPQQPQPLQPQQQQQQQLFSQGPGMPPSKLPPSNYAAGPTPLAANHHLPYANQPFHGHAGGWAAAAGWRWWWWRDAAAPAAAAHGAARMAADGHDDEPALGTVLRALNRKS